MNRSSSCGRIQDHSRVFHRSSPERDHIDVDDERGLGDLLTQIVDVFTKENALDGLTIKSDTGSRTGLVREANLYIREKIRRQREKILNKIIRSREIWKKKKSQHPFCRFIDKVSFTIGVFASMITASLIGRPSYYMVNWYTYMILFLVSIRLYLYRKEGYQYFLLDFCYFTTFLIYIYLYCFPDSHLLFVYIFAFSNGPLAWAVPLWRNSLVFHDLDKLTSCAIHIFPMLLSFQLRWFPSLYSICSHGWPPSCPDVTFSTIAILPLLPYIIWQLAYTLKTQSKFLRLTKPVAIAHDDLIVTSFKWLLNSSEGPVAMILRKLPTSSTQEAAFVALQFIYTFITMTPTILYFRFMYLHALFIFSIVGLAAWNGANFYVEVFTTRYKWVDPKVLANRRHNFAGSCQTESLHIPTADPSRNVDDNKISNDNKI